jgi:hypothetical protein
MDTNYSQDFNLLSIQDTIAKDSRKADSVSTAITNMTEDTTVTILAKSAKDVPFSILLQYQPETTIIILQYQLTKTLINLSHKILLNTSLQLFHLQQYS